MMFDLHFVAQLATSTVAGPGYDKDDVGPLRGECFGEGAV